MKKTNWIVLTGGPASGITSLGNYFRLCGFDVVPECARAIIDLGRSVGLTTEQVRVSQIELERKILKIQSHIESTLDPEKFMIIERGIPDVEAYGIAREEAQAFHRYQYKQVFLLDCVEFVNDYARTESSDEAKRIDAHIEKTYQAVGYKTVRIPKLPIADRLEKILSHLNLSNIPSLNAVSRSLF